MAVAGSDGWFRTYRRLWSLFLRRPATLAAALLAMAGAAAATGAFAALTGPAARLLFTGGKPPTWLHGRLGDALSVLPPERVRLILPLLLFGLALVRAVLGYLQTVRMARLALSSTAELQEALHARILTLPLSYFAGRHSGEIFSRFGNDLGEVERALTQGLAYSLRDALQLLALLVASALLDWRLLLLSLVTVPLTAWPIARFARSLRGVSGEVQEQQARLVAETQDMLAGAAVLKVYGGEAAALRSLSRGEKRLLGEQRRSALLRAAFSPTVELMGIGAFALVLIALQAGLLAVPPDKLISFLGAVMLTYQPVKSLAQNSQWIAPGLAAADRIFALLDSEPSVADRPGAKPLPRPSGRGALVELQGVTVRYTGASGSAALREVDLRIEEGELLGIVGPSGSGKSTLLHLLPRLLDPTEGTVRIAGRDLREVTLASLRGQVSLVAQDVFLFDASVAENVRAAAPSAPDARLWDALEAAGAREMVERLPQGLETRLGERGATLSGGQRQRLSLARALLKDAPLLLLDEATSALDSISEARIEQALRTHARGRTIVWVTHRLGSVLRADRLVVLDTGRLVEAGTPDELRRASGWYGRMSTLQATGHAGRKASGKASGEPGGPLEDA
jgi:subfamily B ATP-binding cassette protein MsbA